MTKGAALVHTAHEPEHRENKRGMQLEYRIRNLRDLAQCFKVGDRMYICGYALAKNCLRPTRDVRPTLAEVISNPGPWAAPKPAPTPTHLVPVGKTSKLAMSKACMWEGLHFTDNLEEAWDLYFEDVQKAHELWQARVKELMDSGDKLTARMAECKQQFENRGREQAELEGKE